VLKMKSELSSSKAVTAPVDGSMLGHKSSLLKVSGAVNSLSAILSLYI